MAPDGTDIFHPFSGWQQPKEVPMRVLSICVLVAVFLAGCTGCPDSKGTFTSVGTKVGGAPADEAPTGAIPSKDKAKWSDKKSEGKRGDEKKEEGKRGDEPKSREDAKAEALVAAAPKAGWKKTTPEPQSGRLTAGSFDDNLFPDAFRLFT